MKQVHQAERVCKRFLWLYGLYALLNMGCFLLGYSLLPEGFMRNSPYVAIGSFAASASSFWGEFALTLLFNLGVVFVLCILANLQQVNGIPMGYVVLVILAIVSGLVAGTNSFAASDLKQVNAWEGTALGMSIGGIEMVAYVLAIAATVTLGLYNYTFRQWQGKKIKSWREIRLSLAEILCLVGGLFLLLLAAYRETQMAFGG